MAERGNQRQACTGARNRDVQAPLATLLQKRAEPVQKVAGLVLSISDRQDDGIPFITLHTLQVLDEKALVFICSEKLLQLGVVLPLAIEGHLDPLGVLDAHSDHPEAFTRPAASMLDDEVHDALNLPRGALVLRAITRNVRHQLVSDCAGKPWPGKRNQPSTIDAM